MKRKPREIETLVLCGQIPLDFFGRDPVVSSRVIVSHLPNLDVKWRLYKVQVAPNHFKWGVESMAADTAVIRRAA